MLNIFLVGVEFYSSDQNKQVKKKTYIENQEIDQW